MADWILREGPKSSVRYRRADGRLVKDARTLERIRRLAIPPAWTDVHIAASPRASVQAWGHVAQSRKQ
jgi:DNA topoisomerase-1